MSWKKFNSKSFSSSLHMISSVFWKHSAWLKLNSYSNHQRHVFFFFIALPHARFHFSTSRIKMRMCKSDMRMWQSDKKTLAFEYEFSFKRFIHRLIKTQIGHARDFGGFGGDFCTRDSVTRACTDSRARKPLQLREKSTTLLRAWVVIVRHLDYILFTRAGDGRWPQYQAKSL